MSKFSTQQAKQIKSTFSAMPTTSRNAADRFGCFQHWLYRDTGIRRNNRWTPRLLACVEYSAAPKATPKNGGDFPAGHWETTAPTGKRKVQWD